jgi:GT2 family glycosyltransferase
MPNSPRPWVTIVVPVYNGAQYIRESLDSILEQSYPNIDVLVMDDGSTDATADIITSYGPAIRSFRQRSTVGQFENVNAGVGMAQGDFIAVYHADDIYLPTIVEREVDFLLTYPEAGAVFASDIMIDANGREYARLSLPRAVRGNQPLDRATIINSLLTHKNIFLRCPTSMVRAEAYRAVGPYRQDLYRNNADLDMWLRIVRHYPIGILEQHLYKYRHFHGGSRERHNHLRTEQGRNITILDDHLTEWASEIAMPAALAAHEAHRAEDALMRVVSHYILGQMTEARRLLGKIRVRRLLGSRQVQRVRLSALFGILQLLVRMPRSHVIANLFKRRWHGTGTVGTRQGHGSESLPGGLRDSGRPSVPAGEDA